MEKRTPLAGSHLRKEQADLAKAEQHLGEGQMRVTEQELRVERLRGTGRDATVAEDLLVALRATLEEWSAHREEILRTIRRLQASEP